MPIDLDLYLRHTEGRGLVEVLLRGHLWVEKHLISLLEAELAKPEALDLDRVTFSQRVKIANALGMLSPDEVGMLRKLNQHRNRLAHDLTGHPTEAAVEELEQAAPESQRELASKLLPLMQTDNPPEGEAMLAQRLAVVVLALLTEMEQHSQWHTYWKQHNLAMEGYRIMVATFKRIGKEPESIEEYRRAVDIPDPPTPGDAILRREADPAEE